MANICIKTIVNIAYTLTHTHTGALCGGGVGGRERRGGLGARVWAMSKRNYTRRAPIAWHFGSEFLIQIQISIPNSIIIIV